MQRLPYYDFLIGWVDPDDLHYDESRSPFPAPPEPSLPAVEQANTDHDFLTVEGVARLMRCSVDSARRIPRDELPAYLGPGRHLLYLRADLVTYLRRRNAAPALSGRALQALLDQ